MELALAADWGDEHHAVGVRILEDFAERDCPPGFKADFGSLPPPADPAHAMDAWLNDTVLALVARYIQAALPDDAMTPQAAPVHPAVCILGPLAASKISQAHIDGNFNEILKWMRAQSNFATLKRIVFPANVTMNHEEQYVLAQQGSGTHWLAVDLCLQSDTIDIHDWVDLPRAHYDNLLPALRAFMSQMHSRCNVGNMGGSVIEARVRHLAHQNNAYDCGIFTSYFLFVASRPGYMREDPHFDLTSEFASYYRLWLLNNLAPFYLNNPKILESTPESRCHRHVNAILGNISLSLSIFLLPLSIFLTHTQTNMYAHTHTHTHTSTNSPSFSLSLSVYKYSHDTFTNIWNYRDFQLHQNGQLLPHRARAAR